MCPISSIQDFFKYADKDALDEIRYLVVLLINPTYLTDAGKIVFDNLPYLDLRTRNVHFFIPGYAESNYNLLNNRHYNSRSDLGSNVQNISFESFDFRSFVMSVDWLEHKLYDFTYNEGATLCVIDKRALVKSNPFTGSRLSEIYFSEPVEREDYVAFDLDALHHEGQNVVKLFSDITMKLERNIETIHELRYFAIQSNSQVRRGLPMFIAGSKSLENQRNSVKSELLSLQNRLDYLLRIYTFEDFDDSFTEGGRQEQYDFFIRNKAQYIIFILDGKVGGITLKEFEIAMDSFHCSGHPKIFVYSKIEDDQNEDNDITCELRRIRDYCTASNQYYTEYRYDEQLPLLVYRSFSNILL